MGRSKESGPLNGRRPRGVSRTKIVRFFDDASSRQPVEPIIDLPSLRHLALPLESVRPSANSAVQRVATALEFGAKASSAKYGYGPGEGLIEAYRLNPTAIESLVNELDREGFATSNEALANSELETVVALTTAIRNVLAQHPKPA